MADSTAVRLTTGSDAGQAQADRADLGVRLGAELGRAAAEHLGLRVQLDVHLEPEHRVEALDDLVVVDQRRARSSSVTSSSGTALDQRAAVLGVAGGLVRRRHPVHHGLAERRAP